MSRAPSSKAIYSTPRLAAALLATLLCASCGRGGGASGGGDPSVGYVRMNELIKVHPLYGQLSHYDEDIAALQLKSAGGQPVARSGADVQRETAALQKQLDAAADRAKTILKQKQEDYQRRENDAIKAVLASAGGISGASAGAIAGQMTATTGDQARAVAVQAQSNLNVFRQESIAQDKAQTDALSRSLAERANRTYREKAEELHEREAAFALQEANADAAQRLSLRTKLSNLPLDDAGRKDITDQLDAIDRKEADALAAMRNRDQVTLAALESSLADQTKSEFRKESDSIHSRTNAKITERASQMQGVAAGPAGGTTSTTVVAPGAASLTPAMRERLLALHKQYQVDFQKDADQTIRDFMKTKEDLSRKFADLQGADAGAQGDAQRKIDDLQKQRDQLYSNIISQIDREVKIVAERRAVTIVVSDVVAPVGVDLTDDAEKDIESLHE
jgi:hypothetical protein